MHPPFLALRDKSSIDRKKRKLNPTLIWPAQSSANTPTTPITTPPTTFAPAFTPPAPDVLPAAPPAVPVALALGVETIDSDAVGVTRSDDVAALEADATAELFEPQVAAETLPRRDETLASPPEWAPAKTEERVADWSALPVEV